MPVNPITFDKIEQTTIRQMENKVVDKVVHEIKGAELSREDQNQQGSNFNEQKQEHAAKQFAYYLGKFNIKLEYKLSRKKILIKLKDKNNKLLIEKEVDDIETILRKILNEAGNIIDLKG